MEKSKRFLSLLLALTLSFSLVGNAAVTAWADDVPQGTQEASTSVEEPKTTDPADNNGGDTDPAAPTDPATPADPAGDNGEAKDEPQQQDGEDVPAAEETVAVPTRKEGYPAETSDKVKTGMAYLLSDLQAGKVFQAAEGQSSLKITNFYYERSTDGGQTWSPKAAFSDALFGMTTIQITENTAGVYVYRFYASHDGTNFSTDTWTLTLTVEDDPTMDFTFYVGKDYTGSYPIIKLYNVEKDAEGNETLGDEIENPFLYSNFTSTPDEGEEAYDVAGGKLVSNYQMFYASLTAGRYAYRAFAKNADTGAYDVALGGMTLDLPTDTNVDGGAGGGTSVYLQCNSFYVSSKKTDNTYFTADEYHVRVDCPIMKTSCEMGDPYIKGNYTYYPTVLYAAGNACLYNTYAYPDIDGYIFTQAINQTFRASYSAGTKSLQINTGVTLDITVPTSATFGLYFQWNNFNTTEVAPVCADESIPYAERWTDNGNGTKTAQYFVSMNNSNYTWRLSDAAHVTQAGWLTSVKENAELTFGFADDAATDRLSHDFSKLGSQTTNRDEADLQVNLDPTGFQAITGTTRVRAYRHWQLINSDAGNIMVEPDFHWNTLSGDASIATVNGGNTTANWADITPGTQDSVITVYYDSVDVNHGNYGSHGGLYPATNPERVGVIVVGGTGVTHGTADADVDFNMAPGTTTTRPMDWDYNYDTWFYGANETNPALNFAVTSTGDTTVEYAVVTTTSGMTSTLSGFTTVSASADGRYTVPLNAFNAAGTNGGTVIIKMTDATGVSYRLVRVAKVTITATNVSNPGEDIMPGDQVKLSFKGMYRAVNKISGIFNPTVFKPTYYAGETKFEGTLGQYQRMDNATVTVTVPADVTFADGASTTEYTFTNGYTYGSMYSAANPFAFLYGMTDTGVGTNFNAVTVTYYLNHYADVAVTVARKVTYDMKLDVTDDNGKAVEGATVTVYDKNGNVIAPNEDGTYTLGYGNYTYTVVKDGYVCSNKSFKLGSADAADVKDGKLVKDVALTKAAEGAWDGTTVTEPAADANGVYQISNGAELAWFAQTVNGGKGSISAVLTKDIDLAGYNWTPIGTNSSNSKIFSGSFDGQGHTVDNLYINYKANTSAQSPYQGFFGYVYGSSTTNHAVIKDLTVRGEVILGGTKSVSTAYCGGVVGRAYDTDLINIHAEVNVSLRQSSGNWQIIGGVIGDVNRSTITNCSNSGEIRVNRYGAGIAGSASSTTITGCFNNGTVFCPSSGAAGIVANLGSGSTVSNCYNSGRIGSTGSNVGGIVGDCGNATVTDCINIGIVECKQVHGSLIGNVSNANTVISNLYYLEGTCAEGIGKVANAETQTATVKTAAELKTMITAGDHPYKEPMLADLTVVAQEIADKAAVDNVIDLIDKIGDVTLDSEAAIKAADDAFNALSPELQAKVTNADTLTEAKAALAQLKKAADDKAAADAAIDKINGIGSVTASADSKKKIDEARKAYDALTDDQKKLVPDEILNKLTGAERTYKNLTSTSGSSSSSGKTDTKTDGKNVKSGNTGDDSHVILWLGGVVLSAAALALLAKKRRQDA